MREEVGEGVRGDLAAEAAEARIRFETARNNSVTCLFCVQQYDSNINSYFKTGFLEVIVSHLMLYVDFI